MKNSTIVKGFLFGIVLVIIIGWILPFLLSSANTLYVVFGVAISLGLLLWLILSINSYLNKKDEISEKK